MIIEKDGKYFIDDIVEIIKPAILVDKKAGIIKFGNFEDVYDYYKLHLKKFSQAGFYYLTTDLLLFDLSTILTLSEASRFINHFIDRYCCGEDIIKMICLQSTELKELIKSDDFNSQDN